MQKPSKRKLSRECGQESSAVYIEGVWKISYNAAAKRLPSIKAGRFHLLIKIRARVNEYRNRSFSGFDGRKMQWFWFHFPIERGESEVKRGVRTLRIEEQVWAIISEGRSVLLSGSNRGPPALLFKWSQQSWLFLSESDRVLDAVQGRWRVGFSQVSVLPDETDKEMGNGAAPSYKEIILTMDHGFSAREWRSQGSDVVCGQWRSGGVNGLEVRWLQIME